MIYSNLKSFLIIKLCNWKYPFPETLIWDYFCNVLLTRLSLINHVSTFFIASDFDEIQTGVPTNLYEFFFWDTCAKNHLHLHLTLKKKLYFFYFIEMNESDINSKKNQQRIPVTLSLSIKCIYQLIFSCNLIFDLKTYFYITC